MADGEICVVIVGSLAISFSNTTAADAGRTKCGTQTDCSVGKSAVTASDGPMFRKCLLLPSSVQ